MNYTQQELVRVWKKLIPSITENKGKLKIEIRNTSFTLDKNTSSKSQVVSTRNIGYR